MLRKARHDQAIKLALDTKKARFTLKRNQIIDYRAKSAECVKTLQTFQYRKRELEIHIKQREQIVTKEQERHDRLQAIELNTVRHLQHERQLLTKNLQIIDRNKKQAEAYEREIYDLERELNKIQNQRIAAEKEWDKLEGLKAERQSEIRVLDSQYINSCVKIQQTKRVIEGLEENLDSVINAALE